MPGKGKTALSVSRQTAGEKFLLFFIVKIVLSPMNHKELVGKFQASLFMAAISL